MSMSILLKLDSISLSQFSFLNQILLLATGWILLVFTIDCWFSPFYLQGYQLASLLLVLVLIGGLALEWVIKYILQQQQPFDFGFVAKNQGRGKLQKPEQVLQVFECEIRNWAEAVTRVAVRSWYVDVSDNQDFLVEVQTQLEDLFILVARRVISLPFKDVARSLTLLLHRHLQNHLVLRSKAGSLSQGYRFSHPVSKGECSLETYLQYTATQFLRCIIPGSVQDCEAVFHFLCLVFARQILWNLVESTVKPQTLLRGCLKALKPDNTVTASSRTKNDTTDSPLKLKHTVSVNPKPVPPTLDIKPTHAIEVEAERQLDEPVPKDLSPVYEEVEDFASAIARLRSLLEQRDSQQSIGSDSGTQKGSLNCSSAQGRLVSETDSSFEELTDVFDGPLEGRIFSNVTLAEAELCTVSGDFVYSVIYDAVYAAAGTDISASLPESLDSEVSMAVEARETRYVLKKRTVRRRFAEFLRLHSQLMASALPAVRSEIRSVRGPSKWLSLPFSRSDQSTVNYGRKYLERYLQQVSSSAVLSSSSELRHFLDYEFSSTGSSDSDSIASSIATQRLDRFLVKTVSGVLQSIRTALPIPGADSDAATSPSQLVPLPPPPVFPTSVDCVDSKVLKEIADISAGHLENGLRCSVVIATEPSRMAYVLDSYVSMVDFRVDSAYDALEFQSPKNDVICSPIVVPLQPSCSELCEELAEGDWNRFDEMLPLASAVINLLTELLISRQTLLSKSAVTYLLKVFLGQPLQQYIENLLEDMTNPTVILEQLKKLRNTFEADEDISAAVCDPADIGDLKKELIAQLKSILPGGFSYLVGEDTCQAVMDDLVSCFCEETLNRDLVLTFLDLTLSLISVATSQT